MNKTMIMDEGGQVTVRRGSHGVPHVAASSLAAAHWGMGYAHAWDRGMQMLLMLILGQGRASEFLDSSDETLEVDRFFRRMNWTNGAAEAPAQFTDETRACCEAYCAGANARFAEKVPWELRLLGYKPSPWIPEDSILISRMAGYVSLSQSQAEIERLFIQMVQAGVSRAQLEELFPGNLDGFDEELIKSINVVERIVPAGVLWKRIAPPMTGSNNWVVAPGRTASGKAILCNDPHLETNRLPNVWAEMTFDVDGFNATGATMPGMPALLLGRTPDLAWGATYTFMDTVDSWVEDCREGSFLYEREWKAFDRREEIIKRKGKAEVRETFFENNHGVLEGDPHVAGRYLATRWSGANSGAVSLNAANAMWNVRTVPEAMECLGTLETAWNWVLADSAGNIGYQMSGLLPRRREGVNGFMPMAGWLAENDWQGFVPHSELARSLNPDCGYIVTANQDLNHLCEHDPINMPMGSYRAERIEEVLSRNGECTIADMQALQYDVYSRQAAPFMDILRPLLPDGGIADTLRNWDCCYSLDSHGAVLFERFYDALVEDVIGNGGVGEDVARFILDESGILVDFYQNFDRILLAENSLWFGGRSRETVYRVALDRALVSSPPRWGNINRLPLENILFGGKLPPILGFDRGPVPLRGGRGTPHQGQIYRAAGRGTSFTPSYRFVTDFAESGIHSNIAGGPSDRRFSKWYCSELENWVNGDYKKLDTP